MLPASHTGYPPRRSPPATEGRAEAPWITLRTAYSTIDPTTTFRSVLPSKTDLVSTMLGNERTTYIGSGAPTDQVKLEAENLSPNFRDSQADSGQFVLPAINGR